MPSAPATLGFGFRVGHWTDDSALTGCTVILPPPGNVTSCDIRGSSPGSRELTMLDPDRKLSEVHAILFTGGSAFGLAAADGVMSWLEEHDIGYRTPIGVVPIVPAAVVFDLGTGQSDIRPGPAEGRFACEAAREDFATGRIGAGTGATVGKWSGRLNSSPGGIGIGVASQDDVRVSALAVVNSIGDVLAEDGSVLAGTTAENPRFEPPPPVEASVPGNTVLALVAAEGHVDKLQVRWLAGRGSDGITATIRPAHTRYDGDVTIACVAPGPPVQLDLVGFLATQAVAAAVRNAVS